MSLLDTVEPDWWDEQGAGPFYSRETVKSLLTENRKQVWLEAAEYCDELAKLYPREDVGFDKGYSMCAVRAANELRRMAESDKTTMEGEN